MIGFFPYMFLSYSRNLSSLLNMIMQGAPQNSTAIVRPGPASTDPPLPELRNSSVDGLPKVWNSGDCVSNHKPLKVSINQSDKQTLKFRIKVGSDNILTEKSAAIYSNLGLDMSPSSSSEGSHTEWEGNSPDSYNKQGESPSCIIKVNSFSSFCYLIMCFYGQMFMIQLCFLRCQFYEADHDRFSNWCTFISSS
jgi:hypothetical protein